MLISINGSMKFLRSLSLVVALIFSSSDVLAQTEQITSSEKSQEQKWQVNFKDSDIQEVIKFVADVTGKTIVIDPRVKGRVKVISSQALNRQGLYDLFLSVLEVQGFTAVEIGNVVRILPRKDARTSAVPVTNRPDLGSDAYITQVIQLYHVSAAKVLPVLRPLAPQHAHLAAYDPSNAIIISDTVANISRLRDVISRIDRAGVAETEILTLEYAQADTMVKMLKALSQTDEKDSPANAKTLLTADARSNSILVTGDDVRRNRIKQLVERLDVPRQQSGNVRVIYLEYADAEEMATVLQKVVSNLSKLNPAGDKGVGGASNANVEADPSTNSLLITADATTLETLLPIINRLDIRRAQVLVEAIIVEITGNLNRTLGVEWAAYKENSILGGSFNSTNILTKLIQGTLSSSGSGITLGIGDDNSARGGASFAALISALQTNSEANILSTPSILTTDNNTATISIGENVPFITGSFSNDSGGTDPFQTIERRDVGINLSVTPQISEGNTVVLEIDQEVSGVSDRQLDSASDIITTERKITTQVIANDNQVIILGGLQEERVNEISDRVPLLSDIPFLGNLFRYDSNRSEKKNLMIFLKASIIRSEEVLRGATAEKYNYIRGLQTRNRAEGVALMGDDVIPLLPEWDEKAVNLENTELGRVDDIDQDL
ncbi:MAG: general secretion pathway protein D [Cellvibrionaceae bacterium]|jgi:general secretion pathway protein D